MHFDPMIVITDENGKPMPVSAPERDKDGKAKPVDNVTVGLLAKRLLSTTKKKSDEKLDGDEAFKRFRLALKIHDALEGKGPVDLTLAECNLILDLAENAYVTTQPLIYIYGQMRLALDPAERAPKKAEKSKANGRAGKSSEAEAVV